ncbi:putative glutamine amidotransferase [Mumia flava]|uniref:Putative glutamine amidotransferase n=1 Tax=Mumia flava TaxID=1348852 RepID=A0A0B2BUU7_9ACTN|nr:gamma-glutamyl-gamma-aminobutyrate hydrolase family protein [Mumia flava]PJJ58076.1 putative glutamine amidotransferase [Mumia flava]
MSGSEQAPVVGVSTYRQRAVTGVWDVEACLTPAPYVEGVTRAGGIAVLLPPQPADAAVAAAVLDRLDGLVLVGGSDVDPALYGAGPHDATDPPQRQRDTWEALLVHEAIARGVPFLGICRGAQVLGVALGGTLHQHVPEVIGHHGHRAGNAVFTPTVVTTVPGTRVADILGDGVTAPCYHHQAIDRVADGLVVGARDDDGLVEAVELPDHPFGVAVQWHPEEDLDDLRLFAALVDASARRRTGAYA